VVGEQASLSICVNTELGIQAAHLTNKHSSPSLLYHMAKVEIC